LLADAPHLSAMRVSCISGVQEHFPAHQPIASQNSHLRPISAMATHRRTLLDVHVSACTSMVRITKSLSPSIRPSGTVTSCGNELLGEMSFTILTQIYLYQRVRSTCPASIWKRYSSCQLRTTGGVRYAYPSLWSHAFGVGPF
jgi:hypothetical protein